MAGRLTTREQTLRAVRERQFQEWTVDVATRFGWWVWHDNDSRRNRAGLPDLILVRPPRVVFVELKRETGRLRPEQARVLALLERCPGVESYVWRPSDEQDVLAALGRANTGGTS